MFFSVQPVLVFRIANHHSQINAQLYSVYMTQIFCVWFFLIQVKSASSKLLTIALKSGLNGCKERLGLQEMLMRIEIEGLLGPWNYKLVLVCIQDFFVFTMDWFETILSSLCAR